VTPGAGQPVKPEANKPEASQPAVKPEPAQTQPAEAAKPPASPAPAQPIAPARIKFNFKEAPFDQVLDFFSRESGLPKIDEAAVPQGNMTFISGESYPFDDALTILNLNLLPKGVVLTKEKNYLYLRSIKDSARKASEVYVGKVPGDARTRGHHQSHHPVEQRECRPGGEADPAARGGVRVGGRRAGAEHGDRGRDRGPVSPHPADRPDDR
jgi:hypothetical protein